MTPMDQEPPNNTTHRPPQPSNSGCSHFIRRLSLSLFLSLTICSFIISIPWLVLDPHLPDFKVNSLVVSNFSLPGSQVYDFEIEIRNPNKKISLSFDHLIIYVSYGSLSLSKASIAPPPPLKKMTQERVRAKLWVHLQPRLRKKKAFKNLVGDLSSGVVSFTVKMQVSTDFRAGDWLGLQRSIFISCQKLKVSNVSSKSMGKLKDTTELCAVTRF